MTSKTPNDRQSPSRRLRFLAGLAVLLICLVVAVAWQLRPRTRSGDSRNQLVLAKQLLASGQLELAEVALKSHVERIPDSVEALDELRWLYFNQLRTREIERAFEAHLARFPDDVAAAGELLNCEFRKQLPREGIGYLREVDRQRPGQAPVQLALGYCLWKIGELDAAQTALQAALSLRPRHRETRYIVAEFLLESGEVEAASVMLAETPDLKNNEQAPAAELDDDQVWYLRSLIAERKGEVEAAYMAIERASRLRPGELRYVHREGLLLQRRGRNEEATVRLRRANELEGFQSELSEIVLRGRLSEPTPELCERLAELLHECGRDVQSHVWRRAGSRLAVSQGRS